jgi:hypothetical protein
MAPPPMRVIVKCPRSLQIKHYRPPPIVHRLLVCSSHTIPDPCNFTHEQTVYGLLIDTIGTGLRLSRRFWPFDGVTILIF